MCPRNMQYSLINTDITQQSYLEEGTTWILKWEKNIPAKEENSVKASDFTTVPFSIETIEYFRTVLRKKGNILYLDSI